MDFLQQLQIFVSVVDHRSFARTAEALGMTRPSVTNAVNGLEDALGARLLQRTTRRTSPTVEGQLLYERALRILSEVGQARNLFGGSREAPKGRLRVDIPVALAKPVIVPKLQDFRTRYPEIEIILGVSDQPVDLLTEGVDCVLRIGNLPVSSMISRVLAKLTFVVCAAPRYFEIYGTPANVDDLHRHRVINYFSGRGHRPIPWRTSDGDLENEIKIDSSLSVNDAEAFVACAIAGMGIIQVPGLMVSDHLENGCLVEAPQRMWRVQRPLSIMYPARDHLAPQVRAFIDWTTDAIADSYGAWIHEP